MENIGHTSGNKGIVSAGGIGLAVQTPGVGITSVFGELDGAAWCDGQLENIGHSTGNKGIISAGGIGLGVQTPGV